MGLAERELARTKRNATMVKADLKHDSSVEKVAVLAMIRDVMSRLDSGTLIDKVSEPVLWHSDLHMDNIFVSEQDPAKIVSIIDWQSTVVSPLFLQARFPEFLSVDEDYDLGTNIPQLPQGFDQMDALEKQIAQCWLKEARLSKVYELSSGAQNNRAYKALFIPLFLRELFTRCAEVSKEGLVPLCACLIELSDVWNDVGFTGECPFSFSEDDLQRHIREFQAYRDFQKVQDVARKLLATDSEGWIDPRRDFIGKHQQNEDLLALLMRTSSEYSMTPEEVREIGPFRDRS
jgi:hypothetical protein